IINNGGLHPHIGAVDSVTDAGQCVVAGGNNNIAGSLFRVDRKTLVITIPVDIGGTKTEGQYAGANRFINRGITLGSNGVLLGQLLNTDVVTAVGGNAGSGGTDSILVA